MSNKSVLARTGRKRAIADKIISLVPNDFSLYVEAFVGSGDVYYAMDLPPTTKAVINDLDKQVYKAHKLLKQIKSVPDPYAYDMSDAELQLFVNKKQSSPIAQLVRLMSRFSGAFSGYIGSDDDDVKLYKFAKSSRKLKRVEGISNYMKNTTVLNQDYKAVIKKYDGKGTFFYLDPPYESTEGDVYDKDSIDYDELARVLKNIKGKFLLSINDDKRTRDLFNNFNLTTLNVKQISTFEGIKSKTRKELFVQNY